MRTISARPTGRPAARRSSTMSKPLYLGDLAQPGRPSTGLPSSSAVSSRLPGSTGMPKWMTLPPACLDAGRHHVVAVDDRRGAGDQEEVAALGLQFLQRVGDRLASCAHAALADQGAAERGQALVGRARPPCREPCRACPAAASAPARRASPGTARPRSSAGWLPSRPRSRAPTAAARRGIGNDLHRRHHLARLDARERRQGRDRHRLVRARSAHRCAPGRARQARPRARNDCSGR